MAGNHAVWGIDIGQCSLKALRCREGDAPGQIVAEAFDFIAYPKILSQPGAEPAELIRDALAQFLSRNTVRGDRVAISVPGQNGLARFIKLPPVESSKIPDIVRYEARQQIPFDLNDVIWDYQRMGGGAEEEGFALETEVGLFAMKRDQVQRALDPLTAAGIAVDVIQLTPLALYNFLLFDQMQDLPPVDQYDPDDPPPSTVILSLGTDATDLVVTNGYRVWQRSIPLGGNHFTKALTKELKLTFAKAEHLKCNAASAPDPKALFQAMRPVFNDLLTEIQRSIGYFTSIDRHANIKKVVALGNAMKMPGLRRYLSQSLGYEVIRVDSFEHLTGPEVVGAPTFKENLPSFGVAYGLAVQGLNLGRGTLKTNLLPHEIVKERFIRSKKPWALAGAAMLLLGCAIGYGMTSLGLIAVAEEKFKDAESQMTAVTGRSSQLKSEAAAAKTHFDKTQEISNHLVGNVDNRVLWPEMLRALSECLPQEPEGEGGQKKDIHQRNELHIESIESQQVDDLATWYAGLPEKEKEEAKTAEDAVAAPDPAAPAADADQSQEDATKDTGPTGPGWMIHLTGYHYHNPEKVGSGTEGAQYVRETLLANLKDHQILLPVVKKEDSNPSDKEPKKELVSMKELGIGYPVLIWQSNIHDAEIEDPDASLDESEPGALPTDGGGLGMPIGKGRAPGERPMKTVRRCDFTVEFAWQPKSPTARKEAREAEAAKTTESQ